MMVIMKFFWDRNFGRAKFRLSRKTAEFSTFPIGLKFGILGISGILNMMVIMKFFCERNFVRPKKRPNFQRLLILV